jgi:hypothetical protein
MQINRDKKRYAMKGVNSQTKARIARAKRINTKPFPWLLLMFPSKTTPLGYIAS